MRVEIEELPVMHKVTIDMTTDEMLALRYILGSQNEESVDRAVRLFTSDVDIIDVGWRVCAQVHGATVSHLGMGLG